MAETKPTRTRKTARSRSKAPQKLRSFNPARGEVMAEIPANSPAEVADIVAHARKVAPEWAAIPPEGRARMLREVRYRIYEMLDELVEIVSSECGKPRFEALALDVLPSISMLYSFERIAPKALRPEKLGFFEPPVLPKVLFGSISRIEWRPFGVVGCITPWNYPLTNCFLATLPALFAGNAIVIKPSEVTPGVGEKLKDIFEPLPSGVVSIVQGGGEVGASLVDAPCDKISFIGSPPTGRRICEAAAKHLTPVVMELGGTDAAIVLDDADIDHATSGVLWGSFFNAGQTCCSIERVYVADTVADRFKDGLIEKLSKLRQGEDGEVGALTFAPQLETVERHVKDAIQKGATLLAGGPDSGRKNEDGSLWYAPTVLADVTDEMEVLAGESFGPVLTISRVADDEDAIRRANEEGVNLTASVWGSDGQRADRVGSRLRAGTVSINGHGVAPGATWGAWGGVGESGFGRLNGVLGLREFSVPVHVTRPLGPAMKAPFWYPYDTTATALIKGAAKILGSRRLGEKLEGAREVAANFGKTLKSKI